VTGWEFVGIVATFGLVTGFVGLVLDEIRRG